ncbi:hypothetical protein MEG_01414 [Bartonella tamiae Th307]|uniref:Uncharacterized protein n=1 Tax=Bartonella tamiae Th239 TaxID=1094558 RepID=J1K219_9HYPH|nr:hypothetical protein ME5_00467 [Bartonella tamiae Th239]EJF93200.1 hypothetical protein MEG_01414 [Bartonella tamiae Th307]
MAQKKEKLIARKSLINTHKIELIVQNKKRLFDIQNPKLPLWIKDHAMTSGGYPYAKKMDKKDYKTTLELL